MAKQVQFRRGTTAQHSTFTGAAGEVTVDTDKNVVVVHDGSTAGGHPLETSLSDLGVTATSTELNYVGGVTSNIQTQLDAKGTVSSLSDLSITATSTELNYVDGVTSSIQTQLDGKVGSTYTGNVDITGDLTVDGLTVGTVTFPSTNGTDGYVLTTDGAGNATWQEGGGGGLNETTATTSSTSQTAIATYSTTTYGSAKLIVTVKNGTARQMSELLIVHNGTTASATEYGQIYTGSSLATFEVDISGGNVRLLATPANATTTNFNIQEILVSA